MKINSINNNQYNQNFQAIRKAMPKIREVANELSIELQGSTDELHDHVDVLFNGENMEETNYSLTHILPSQTNVQKTTYQKIKDFFVNKFQK